MYKQKRCLTTFSLIVQHLRCWLETVILIMTIYKLFDIRLINDIFRNKIVYFLNDENSLTLVSETYNYISCFSHEGFIFGLDLINRIVSS